MLDQLRGDPVLGAYLVGQNAIHGQDVYQGVYREGSLDLRADDLGTLQLKQLFNLMLGGRGALERHVSRSTVCTEVRLVWILGREDSVLKGGANEAICLAVPKKSLVEVEERVCEVTNMVSGRRVAATKNTFLPPTLSLTRFSISGFGHETTSILMAVYSWGPKASPSERS